MTRSNGIIIKPVQRTEHKQTQEMTCALDIPKRSQSCVLLACLSFNAEEFPLFGLWRFITG